MAGVATDRGHQLKAALIIGVGIALRLCFWAENPPNNAYDDYLEPIAIVAREGRLPEPAECWECYQPPLYTSLAAAILTGTGIATGSYWIAWKSVQFVSTAASILCLFLIRDVTRRLVGQVGAGALFGLAVAAVMPRDIYTSAMISNDALLVLLTTACVFGFVRLTTESAAVVSASLLVAVTAGVASWVKQSGLVLCLLPAFILGRGCTGSLRTLMLLAIFVAVGAPVWGYFETGRWLPSNQDFYGWATTQPPGELEKISFTDVRLLSLLQEPQLSPATVDSFWTELFARFWFDYEPKYVAIAVARVAAPFAYLSGAVIVCALAIGLLNATRMWARNGMWPLLVLLVVFLLVPMVQTLRYPYYSSMKAMFALPAIAIAASLCGCGYEHSSARIRVLLICGLAGLFASLLIQCLLLPQSLPEIFSQWPVWVFPALPRDW